jgi:hypothetical protein
LASEYGDAMKTTRGRLLVIFAAGALALIVFTAWMMRPQTRFAVDFSEASFTAIKQGDSEVEVRRRVGEPLSSFEEETLEEWCFNEQTTWQSRWFGPSEAPCVQLKDGVVVATRPNGDDRMELARGKSGVEAERILGKPKYIVPAGVKRTLRYSEPQRPTNAFDSFVVIMDGAGVVRGTQHYVYWD